MAVLVEWSRFYVGPAYGASWLATTTDMPMAVFFDPREYNSTASGFRDVLAAEKNEIPAWDIYTNLQTVLEHVESTVVTDWPLNAQPDLARLMISSSSAATAAGMVPDSGVGTTSEIV